MNKKQILEIANRYTLPEAESRILFGADGNATGGTVTMTYWNFCEEELIAFAQSLIEADRDLTTIKVPTVIFDKLKDVNTVTDLINALKAAEKTE